MTEREAFVLARYLEDLAVEASGNSIRYNALREGAWALRKVVSFERPKCQIQNCEDPASVCWECYRLAKAA